jgi:hypothetical protein
MSNKGYWEQRGQHNYGSLCTLGAVSAFGDKERYQGTLEMANPILESELSEEYVKILKWAEAFSRCKVQYDHRLALPGFQIFTNIKDGGDRQENGGIIHRDYLWEGREVADITGIASVDDEYSATIIFSKTNHSLDIWADYPKGKGSIHYKRGVPLLHDHQLMHQVPYEGSKGDTRVSMQIRGFRVGNTITLYL